MKINTKTILKSFIIVSFIFTFFLLFSKNIKADKDVTIKAYDNLAAKQTDNGKKHYYVKLKKASTIKVSGSVGMDNAHPKIVTNGYKLKVNITGNITLKGTATSFTEKGNTYYYDSFIKVTDGSDVEIYCNGHIIHQPDGGNRTCIKLLTSANQSDNKNKSAITIQGGSENNKAKFNEIASRHSGGAIKAIAKYFKVENCRFNKCWISEPTSMGDDGKDYGGGAICVYSSNSAGKKAYIGNCDFSSCWCVNGAGEEKGGAVYAPYGHRFEIWGTTFTNCVTRAKRWRDANGWYGSTTSKHDNNGGAIHTGTKYTLIDGGCTFTHNIAADAGGAIHAVNGGKLLIGYNGNQTIKFENNFASAVPASDAKTGGGAINTCDYQLEIGGIRTGWPYNESTGEFVAGSFRDKAYINSQVSFINNKSRSWGGAIYTNANSTPGNNYICANFTGNTSAGGGALCERMHGPQTIIYNSKFSNNTANNSGNYENFGQTVLDDYKGGAILSYHYLRILDTNQNDIDFNGNKAASHGGAIWLSNPSSNYIDKVYFANNIATKWGGAIYLTSAENTADVGNVSAKLSIWNNSTMSNNKVTDSNSGYGGAIFVNDGLNRSNADAPLLSFGAININNSSAPIGGGGIYNNGGKITLSRWTNINNNSSRYGGGINTKPLSGKNQGVYFEDHATIQNNSASLDGGGIYSGYNTDIKVGASLHFYSPNNTTPQVTSTNITGNTAGRCGGGICNYKGFCKIYTNTSNINSYINISDNKCGNSDATGAGAGVYNDGTFDAKNSPKQVIYCNNNKYGNTTPQQEYYAAEFYNTSNAKAEFIGGSTADSSTILGHKNSNLIALSNFGTAIFTANGSYPYGGTVSEGFTLKSKSKYVVFNGGTFTVQGNSQTSFIDAYGERGIFNANNGIINCTNSSSKLVIRAMSDNAVYGIYNYSTKTNNIIRANIGIQDYKFKTNILNDSSRNIQYIEGIIQYAKEHGIHNKGVISNISNSQIQNNGSDNLETDGPGIYADTNSTTTINSGTTISNNKTSKSGGAIYGATSSAININDNNKLQSNTASTNGGAIYAGTNSTFNIKQNTTIQNNTANKGGGIYADKNSSINLGPDETSSTTKNELLNNRGLGNNIYINSEGRVRDFSTYHKVQLNSGLGSVYVTGTDEGEKQTKGRGIYQIGYSTLYDVTTTQYPAYIYINAGTYIDVIKSLPNNVTKNNVQYKPNIYVMTNDKTKYGTTDNRHSEVGRIIANNEFGQSNVDKFSDGTPRFKHIMTGTGGVSWQGQRAKEVSYSYRLNNIGRNNLFTNSNLNYGETIVKNTNEQYDQNNTNYPDTEYSNNGSKNKQVFLTETYNVNYVGALPDKVNELTQEQLDSITGYSNIGSEGSVQIGNKTVGQATIIKNWYEDINITYNALTSNFGKFDTNNSWQTADGTKYTRGASYTLNEDLTIYAVWSNTTDIIISHYLMNQDGSYDVDSCYTSYHTMYNPENGEYIYGGVWGVPEYQDSYGGYKGIYVYYNNHTSFESWHQLSKINTTQSLTENYITNNLLDNNLIKDNVSEYAFYQIVQDNEGNNTPILKIFYKRKQYTASVIADSGFNATSIVNPYIYNVTHEQVSRYNFWNTTFEKTNSAITATDDNQLPDYSATPDDNEGYAKFSLKKAHTYKFNITFSSDVSVYNSGPVMCHNNKIINCPINYNQESRRAEFTYTPYEDGEYYLGSVGDNTGGEIFGVPAFTGTIYIYNSELVGSITTSTNNLPSNLQSISRTFYAIDNTETRDLSYNGINGTIFESSASNKIDGIYKKTINNKGYVKLNSTISTRGVTNVQVSDQLPQYGNVEYRIVSKTNSYPLTITGRLEKQTYNSSDAYDRFLNTQISTYGMVNIGTLKSYINAYNSPDYVDSTKTAFLFFNGSSPSITLVGQTDINTLNDNEYLRCDNSTYSLHFYVYRKTFTLSVRPGENASSTKISIDNWQTEGTSITERVFLRQNNPFGLPVEDFKTVYLNGQLTNGATQGKWSEETQSIYPYTYGNNAFNSVKTSFKILSNLNETFILNGIAPSPPPPARNITIEHYLQDTTGNYVLQEDKTIYIEHTSIDKIKPDDYKNDSIEYIKNDIKYLYLDYATYLGETYQNTSNNINIISTDEDVHIGLFYSRKQIPVTIYANRYVDEITATANSIRTRNDSNYTLKYEDITDENAQNNGKQLDTFTAYYGEKISFDVTTNESPEDYTISFEGWDNGAYTFDSAHLENASRNYEYIVEAVPQKHISAWGDKKVNQWHIRYHQNYKDDEQTCEHDSEIENQNKHHMIYNYTPSISAGYENWNEIDDFDCMDNNENTIKTATVKGKVYDGEPSYKLLKWHTKDGKEFKFGDTISRLDENGDPYDYYNPSTRTIDLYAQWKYQGAKINIYTEDVYVEVGQEITPEKILENIHVSNGKGDLLNNEESNLGIVKVEVEKEYQNDFKYPENENKHADTPLAEDEYSTVINSDYAKTYLITVRADAEIDDVHCESLKTFKVIVYENTLSKFYIRAIDNSLLDTLPIDSVWREPRNYARLIKTLNKGRENSFEKKKKEAKYIFAFNSSDMEEIKQKIKENGYKYKDVIKDSNIKKQPEED